MLLKVVLEYVRVRVKVVFHRDGHYHGSCQNFIFFLICHFDQITKKFFFFKFHVQFTEQSCLHMLTEPQRVVYDVASLELMAGECQEFWVLVSLRKMAPPYYTLVSCLESSVPS